MSRASRPRAASAGGVRGVRRAQPVSKDYRARSLPETVGEECPFWLVLFLLTSWKVISQIQDTGSHGEVDGPIIRPSAQDQKETRVLVKCTKCGVTLKVPETAVGRVVKCPKCGNKFVLETKNTPEVIHEAQLARTEGECASSLDELASALQPPPMPPMAHPTAAPPAAPSLGLNCFTCGYRGLMPKKYPTWVIVCAILFFPLGLLFLSVGRKFRCPHCGTMMG